MGQTIGFCPFDFYYRNNLIHNTDGVEDIWPVGSLSQFFNYANVVYWALSLLRQPNIKIRLKNPPNHFILAHILKTK